jgi:plasmid stabilization system protein ParE
MKVIFTEAALADLDDVFSFLASNHPELVPAVEQRIRGVIARVARWPGSARIVEERPGVRVAPLVRYPYKIFYRVNGGAVEILHIHHSSKRPW